MYINICIYKYIYTHTYILTNMHINKYPPSLSSVWQALPFLCKIDPIYQVSNFVTKKQVYRLIFGWTFCVIKLGLSYYDSRCFKSKLTNLQTNISSINSLGKFGVSV